MQPRPRSGRPGAGEARTSLKDFVVKGSISKGSFGTVHRVERKVDGKVYALKQINLENMNRAEREETIDEARVLASLNHKYVVRYYDCFIEDKLFNIVMFHASGGTIHSKIQSLRGQRLQEDLLWKYFCQALLGLNHIHKKKIIHRDIKSLNLFLDSEDNVKVGDLGIAKVLSNSSIFAKTILGTPYYLSPELCEDKPYNERSDIWALGVVLYELCTGKHPFDATNEGALIRKILRGTYAPIQNRSGDCTQIVSMCLTMDPRRRPDCSTLLKHPIIQNKIKQLNIDLGDAPISSNTYALPQNQPQRPVDSTSASQGELARQGGPASFTRPLSASHKRDGAQQDDRSEVDAPQWARRDPAAPQWPPREPAAPQRPPTELATSAPGGPPRHNNSKGRPYDDQYQPATAAPLPSRGASANGLGEEDPHIQQGFGRMALHSVEGQRQQQRQDVASGGQNRTSDAMRSIMSGGRQGNAGEASSHRPYSSRDDNRVTQGRSGSRNPQDMPAAGARAQVESTRPSSSPFAHHESIQESGYRTASREQAAAMMNARYEPPQFGRRRCNDIGITGPSMRENGRPGGGGAGAGPVRGGNTVTTATTATNIFASGMQW